MRRAFFTAVAALLLATAAQVPQARAQVDPRFAKELGSNAPGSGDQVVPRYAGSFILAQTRKDFDELVLPLGKAIGASYSSEPDKKLRYEKTETVEGRLTRTVYVIPEGRSTLEVMRNYTTDLEAKGASAARLTAARSSTSCTPYRGRLSPKAPPITARAATSPRMCWTTSIRLPTSACGSAR